ncbi:MAG: formate dehydrogenase accessory sulfurtransferase FdhD [Anaerolineales bacterium]|nr:formate dehydrogenase accessory sulfurtransferase FdhD [Anaerolineales bacterium]
MTGLQDTSWDSYDGIWQRIEGFVVEEAPICLQLNGVEQVSIRATPTEQVCLALGFLWNAGLIQSMDDVIDVQKNPAGNCVDVWTKTDVAFPARLVLTTGCGKGISFEGPMRTDRELGSLMLTPEQLFNGFSLLVQAAISYHSAGGSHASGLFDGERLLVVMEDVGRHNTIDKLIGFCLREGHMEKGYALLATGRLSWDMVRKGADWGWPILASRSSATSSAIEVANMRAVTLAGYVRRKTLRVYSRGDRLGMQTVAAR